MNMKIKNFRPFIKERYRHISLFRQCKAYVALFCFFSVLPLSAMDWPVAVEPAVSNSNTASVGTIPAARQAAGPLSARILRNFGWNDNGSPVLGTVFETQNPALAVESGELIFYNSGFGFKGRLPSPLGAWRAIDHGDGLLSIYSRADANSEIPPAVVMRNQPVAAAGISGWSDNTGFYFILYDRRERLWVNPSMIIAPFPDTRPPQILSVELRNALGETVGTESLKNLTQGNYTIVINAVDTMQSQREAPLAPYRIICSINGIEAGALTFDTISAKGGRLFGKRSGLVPIKKIYAPFPAYEAGEVFLSRGQVTLELIVQDICGNSRSAVMRLQVQ